MFKLREVLSKLRGELATQEATGNHTLGTLGYRTSPQQLANSKFGNLSEGEHLDTGETVAIWVIHKHSLTEDTACERLAREIEIKSRVDHPNCIYMYEILEDVGTFSFVEEFCPNGFFAAGTGNLAGAGRAQMLLGGILRE